ncbi:FYVE, RhoGEF and PH domain-containing protein 6 isoform X2 [Anthonomus grandis grandis]|uniref:FYVE, RhoGEF and PH domain-containing protein 6 isoform X2 n=1 Tax=Anthonomus grandis grandis TaxID=2921223 RepID=UPI002164FDAE|nr:FYVE, RhoGEF and PH domain-containing protein 6 isoform X2 [Anthonomus grandis grandis]
MSASEDETKKQLVVKLAPLTPEVLQKYSPKVPRSQKREKLRKNIVGFEPHTPKASIELTLELKKVINERNILTSKTRKRVFDCLDELKSNTEEESRNFKKEKALLEIVNSEIKYVKQLEIIINFFMKPVQEKKLLKIDDYEVLFGNITTIYNINKELLEELDKGFDNVPHAFSKIAPFLKLYSVYAYQFRNNLKILQNARSCNPAFASFIESQETRPEVQTKLSALLITPIQRVPRYKLLLTHLYELSIPKDKNYKLLKECMVKIEEAASHINKVVDQQENAQRLLELHRYMRAGEPNIITPGRVLKKEGILHKMSTKKNGHSEKLYVVLMNDIILFTKMKKEHLLVGSLKVCNIFPLNKTKITEILDKGCMKLTSQEEELILYHDQLSEMVAWVESIQNAIDSYLEDRTLRKESSNRRAVKRKDINEYHEIGVSPGQPLKKRKTQAPTRPQDVNSTPQLHHRIAARRSIHSAYNSTPIKLEDNPETLHLNGTGFPMLETSAFSNDNDSKIEESANEDTLKPKPDQEKVDGKDEIFVFGRQNNDQNVSKISSFFKSFGTGIKGFLGFKKH